MPISFTSEGSRSAHKACRMCHGCDQVSIFKPHVEEGEGVAHVPYRLGEVIVDRGRDSLEEAVGTIHKQVGRLDAQACGLSGLRPDIGRAEEWQGAELGEA